jgi:PilZ domain-containing protein
MQDGRNSKRQRTLKGGRIAFGYGAAIDCTIRNISSSGARLLVASPVGIPDQFELFILSEDSKRPCRVVWRSATQIGVAFGDAIPD